MNITGSKEYGYWWTSTQIFDGECDCHRAALKQIGTWHVGGDGMTREESAMGSDELSWNGEVVCGFDMGEGDHCLLLPGHDGPHS